MVPSASASIFILFVGVAVYATAQDQMLPDDPLKGARVFGQKGCVVCHSVNGQGGRVASDLGKRQFQGGYLGLAQQMWNHFPRMAETMKDQGRVIPSFSNREMEDLFAYLLYSSYLGETGDAAQGKLLLTKKNCAKCHTIEKTGKSMAPDLTKMVYFGSPLYLIRAMWNHGPAMQKQMGEMNLKLPRLNNEDVTNLAAYLQQINGGGLQEATHQMPGNTAAGAAVFKAKHCTECHPMGQKQARKSSAPDLGRVGTQQSITKIAATMWNHIEPMSKQVAKQGLAWPKLTADEMRDLIAYLSWLKFKDPHGDRRQGGEVFRGKHCVKCHTAPGHRMNLPNIRSLWWTRPSS